MKISAKTLDAGYDYLRQHPEIREVLISGGDPLLLQDEEIEIFSKPCDQSHPLK